MENQNNDAPPPVRLVSLRRIYAELGPAGRSSNVPAMPTAASPSTMVLPDHGGAPFQPPRPLLYSYDAPARPDARTTAAEGSDSFRTPLPLAVIFFFLVGFFSIYILRDLMEHMASAWAARRGGGTPRGPRCAGAGGLDLVVLDAFPVRRYSAMKDGECGVECAVCLSEFAGEDAVRLLTVCRHAFHRGCIDLWLASHSTCPVCRSDLDRLPAPEKAVEGAPAEGRQGSTAGAEMATQNGVQLQMGSPRATGLREGSHAEDGYTLRVPE